MLRFCSDEHDMIMFQGEKEDCPLCKANEKIDKILSEKAKIINKIIRKTHAQGIDLDKLKL